MKITVLGCGSSGGVPLIGNVWGDCDPQNPLNSRTRASILVEDGEKTILVDTSPDMRQQLLRYGLTKLDAVLYTHAHADHCHGIDELRSINWLTNKPIDIYAGPMTLAELMRRFGYIFHGGPGNADGNFYKPSALAHEISGPFKLGDTLITPFLQCHGAIRSLGYRFGDFAYSTDVHDFESEAVDILRGIKTWVLDAVRIQPHPTHFNLAQALKWIEIIKPERVFLTHLNHNMDYDKLCSMLPPHVRPAHDGLVIECT